MTEPPSNAFPYQIHVRHLPVSPDPEVAFREVFSSQPISFWLDSSAVVDGLARFSFMGDGSGPLAEYVTANATDGTVTVQRARTADERITKPFFAYLDEQLRCRAVPTPKGLPFDFNLGYVG